MKKDSSKNVRTKIEILEIESHILLARGACFQRESMRNATASENLAREQLTAVTVKLQKGTKL